MFLVSSCSCLCSIHWSHVLSWEWRCSWSSADRRCSNCIWVINNFITYEGATYIRGFTVFKNMTMKINGQGHVCGQRSMSRLTFKIQRSRSWSRSNLMVTFKAWSSIDMFAFQLKAIGPLLTEIYRKFHIWPWKFKVKVMAKVKPDGHIWGIKFNRYVCFLFRGNQTIFGWGIANFIFDLENSRSRSWPRSNPVVTFEP